MAKTPPTFLQEIEAFLADTEMGESYFGKLAAGNSELVSRLRDNRRVWPETEAKVRSFMVATRMGNIRKSGRSDADSPIQPRRSKRGIPATGGAA